MAYITIHAGAITAAGVFNGKSFWLPVGISESESLTIPVAELERVEIASDRTVKRIGAAIFSGIAWAFCLGLFGALVAYFAGTAASSDLGYFERQGIVETWVYAGIAGCAPLGFLIGVIIGGIGKDITFIATFKSGRKLLATTDYATYISILATTFSREHSPEGQPQAVTQPAPAAGLTSESTKGEFLVVAALAVAIVIVIVWVMALIILRQTAA